MSQQQLSDARGHSGDKLMADTPLIQPVIMSGGSGTRLWPMSRKARPKQFISLLEGPTLFQSTAQRVVGDGFLPPVVVAGEAHLPFVEDQLREISIEPAAIIIEPMGRNTAAVAAVAALWTQAHQPDALVALMPADHHVKDAPGFRAGIMEGAQAARRGQIVTMGIKPTEPHTGFGYIEQGDALSESVFKVAAFHEKPQLEKARGYLEGERHFWNAGIFVFSPSAMAGEIETHATEIGTACRGALQKSETKGAGTFLDQDAFGACPSDSIDYAVMEKTSNAAVVGPVDVGWSDIGAWSALDASQSDENSVLIDCDNTLVKSDGPTVTAVGVTDLIIVATGDAVLVMPRERAQDVKKIIKELEEKDRKDLL